MISLEWLIGAIVFTGIVGFLIGYWSTRSSGSKGEIERLESQLVETHAAFETYKKEVVEEFGETAVKFRALNEMYVDLHKQLAKSASALCGETAAGPLLEGSIVKSLADQTNTGDNTATTTEQEIEQSPQVETDSMDEFTGTEDNLSEEDLLSEEHISIQANNEDIIVEVPVLDEIVTKENSEDFDPDDKATALTTEEQRKQHAG